jgi:hypothetical protein
MIARPHAIHRLVEDTLAGGDLVDMELTSIAANKQSTAP